MSSTDFTPAPVPQASYPQLQERIEQIINGDCNIKEALGFLKDWVTALVAIETAAIAGIAALLKVNENPVHPPIQEIVFIYLSLLCFLVSISSGANVLYMLPGCAQRKPAYPSKNDVYSLRTAGKWTLGWWTKVFFRTFVVGLLSFAIFIVLHTFRYAFA